MIAPDLLLSLRRYRWPGNVRQLANALRTACALLDEQETVIAWQHLPDDLAQALKEESSDVCAESMGGEGDVAVALDLRTASRQTIVRTVNTCGGNLSEAARVLGISRNTLYRRLRDQSEGR